MQAQNGRPQWKLQQRAHNIKNWSKLKKYDNGKENYTRGKQQKIRWCRRKDSVQFSLSVVSDSSWPHGLQHTRLPCPSPSPGTYSNSCPLSWWYHPTISFCVVPFSSWLQSFPASKSFPRSYFLTSGDQSIRVSASTSVLSINIQDWFPLGLTGWIFTSLEYRLEGITQSEK